MSNASTQKDYDNLTDVLEFVWAQFLKRIWVSIPGVIESYDVNTKRCRVRPAINLVLTDGTETEQAAVINVPVLWPSGGGFALLCPLPEGTPVEIKFSQRGLAAFKETFSQESPGNGIFAKEDAHVIPGYGSLTVSPATSKGISMQAETGSDYIFINDSGEVEIVATKSVKVISPDVSVDASASASIETASATITATSSTVSGPLTVTGQLIANGGISGSGGVNMAGGMTLSSGDMTLSTGVIKGSNVYNGAQSDLHVHGGVTPGAGDSDTPK